MARVWMEGSSHKICKEVQHTSKFALGALPSLYQILTHRRHRIENFSAAAATATTKILSQAGRARAAKMLIHLLSDGS